MKRSRSAARLAPVRATTRRRPPAAHVEATLPNGLRVVCVPRKGAERAVVTLLIRVGSRFETKGTNGVSHFLEHMLYRGTPSCDGSHAQALAFERLGGMLYAATQVDHGVMTIAFPPESLERVLALFGEVAQHPRLSDIEVERGIVREEILEDLDDEGREVDADNLARALMYGAHPLGYTITGSLAQLDKFDVAMLRGHHARHYTGENCVLCLAGAIEPDEGLELARRCFADLPRGAPVATVAPPLTQRKPRFKYVHNLSSQTELRIAFRGVGDHDPREPAVEALLRVLDDGMSTRLYQRICDSKGLAYDVSALFESYEDDGVFDLAAEVQHARAAQVTREILDLLRDLAEHGPTDEELDKVKLRHGWQMRAMFDDAESLAGFYGLAAIADIARTPAERHAQIDAVTRDEVREAAALVFRPERLSMVAVGALDLVQQKALERELKRFG